MDIGTLTGHVTLEDQLSGQLTSMTHGVKEFASSFDGMTKVVLAGSLAIVGGISAAAASIVALGMKGSTILGVEEAFDTFAKTVGSTGPAMFEAMNQGLRGTVDSMEIMESTTKLLSSGIKVNAGDMNVMAKTAREMAKATGTDASTALGQLSTAVQQGNTRMLKRIGINVDLVKAEKDFAATLGTTRDELSQAGIAQARANAIFAAFGDRLKKTGESALSFKERIQQANVAIGNWFDDLAKGVAKSSAVNAAFDSIRNAFTEVFGGTAAAAQQNILKWIDDFATAAGKLGPVIIRSFGEVKDWIVRVWNELVTFNDRYQITNTIIAGAKFAWGVLEQAFRLVEKAVQATIEAWNQMPEWLQRISRMALEASFSVAAFSIGVGAVASPVGALISKLDLGLNVISNFSVSIHAVSEAWPKLADGFAKGLTKVTEYQKGLLGLIPLIQKTGIVTTITSLATEAWAYVMGTTAVTSLTAMGTAMGAFLLTPLGWVVIAITAVVTAVGLLVGGLRLVTGSWEFLLVPMRTAWQALKDLWVVFTEVVSVVANDLRPVLSDIGSIFSSLARIIKNELIESIKGAKAEVQLFWDLLKDTNEFKTLVTGLQLLHAVAEKIRKEREKIAVTSPAKTKIEDPMAEFYEDQKRLKSLDTTGLNAGPGLNTPDFTKGSTAAEDYAKKVKDLTKSFAEVAKETSVFSDAFMRLTPAQLESYDLQQQLVPEIDKLIAAHKGLAPGMMDVRDAALATRLEFAARDKALLEETDLTLTSIEAAKRLGMTEADLAANYGVTTAALQLRIAALQEAEQNMASLQSFEEKGRAEQAKNTARREALELSANEAISQSYLSLADMTAKSTMTSTEFQIRQIEKEQIAQEVAFAKSVAGLKDAEEYTKRYHDVQERSSAHAVAALRYDQNALVANSKKTQFEQAAYARETYERMARDPENYSKKTIAHFKKIAEEAERAATDTKTFWEQAYGAMGHVSTILDNIPGKFAEIGAVASRTGMAMIEAFGNQDYIGGAIAGVTGLITVMQKLFGASREGRHAILEFMNSFDTAAAGGGPEELRNQLEELGPVIGEQLWGMLNSVDPGDKTAAEQAIMRVRAELDALKEDVDNYNLGWRNMEDRQAAASKQALKLAASFNRLASAGYNVDDIFESMSGDLNDYIRYAVHAGVKIPAAMAPIIEQFIRMNNLSTEAAQALMGLGDAGVPSLEDIREAAEKYGITLDELGPKVKQLEINELAAEYVQDWEILTAATDDWGVLFDKMGPKVQDLITDAIKYGSELPAAMKPMIQAWIDAGRLVDENGDALTDLTQLNWAVDMEEMVESLVLAMRELVDVITNEVGGALDNIGNRTYTPKINPQVIPSDRSGPSDPEEPVYAAKGRVIAFTPRGTDTVPAMLTPGERVVPVGGQPGKSGGGGGTVVIELNARKLAEIVVPEMPDVLTRYKLGR